MTLRVILATGLLCLASPAASELEAGSGSAKAGHLVGPLWRWDRTLMNDDSVRAPEPGSAGRYTVRFSEGGRLSVRADCNRVLGSWEVQGPSIELQAGPATLVQCPEGSRADVFLADLSAAAIHFFRDGDLYLDLRYDSGTMHLVPVEVELAGSSWRVSGYNNGKQAVVSVLQGTELTASFERDGVIVGTAGCNTYRAPYESGGDTLTVGPPAATRMDCGRQPPGRMEQERLFLVALQRSARWSFDGESLELRTSSGALAVRLLAAGD